MNTPYFKLTPISDPPKKDGWYVTVPASEIMLHVLPRYFQKGEWANTPRHNNTHYLAPLAEPVEGIRALNEARLIMYRLTVALRRLKIQESTLSNVTALHDADLFIKKHTDILSALRSSTPSAREAELENAADEREVMIEAFSKFRKMFEGRSWIMDGRGCYPYNDDRYKEEVRYLFDEFEQIEKDMWRSIKSKTFEYRDRVQKKAIAELEMEVAKLKAWKHSAIEVMPDFQPIGEAIGVGLGQKISNKILPWITEKKQELEELKKENERLKDLLQKQYFGHYMQIPVSTEEIVANWEFYKKQHNL